MDLKTTNKIYSFKNGIQLLLLSFFLITVNLASSQSCTVNAGLDMTICENETLQLDGNTPDTYAVGPTWTQIAGPSVIISDPTIPNPTITGYTGGNTYVFQLAAECFNGETPSQTVAVVVEPITQAVAGPDLESCPDSSGSLVISGNAPQNPGETGQWVIFGSNNAGVSIGDDTQATTTISLPGGTAGSTTLRWVITGQEYAIGEFCETFDELVITNYGGVDIIDAGPDQLLSNCYTVSQSTNLAGSFAGNGINGQQGTWTFVSGPTNPTIADPNNNSTQVSDLFEGVYEFRWDVSGSCVSGSDTVTITVPPPTQEVSTATVQNNPIRFCDLSITEATLEGAPGNFTNETVLWEQIQGPAATIVDPTSSTTQVTGLIAPNTYQFRYTIENIDSGCTSTMTVFIRYNSDPVSILVNNGNDIEGTCGQTSIDVPYVYTGGNRTEYSIIGGPAESSLTFPTTYQNLGNGGSPNSATINDFDVAGTYTVNFRRRSNGNLLEGCDQANSSINIFISTPVSGANAGAPQQFICGQDSGLLAGSAILPGETSIWSLLDGPDGMDNSNILDRYEQTASVTGLLPGEYTFSYTVFGGPDCDPSVSTTTVVVTPLTNFPADAGANQSICYNAPVQLNALALSDSQVGLWTASDPSIVFEDDSDPNTIATGFVLPSTAYTLTWTVDEAPGFPDCAPAAVDTVEITTLADESPTIADAGTDFCLSDGTNAITNLGGNSPDIDEIGTWSQISGPSSANFLSVNDPTSGVDNLVNGIYIFRWTIGYDAPAPNACPDTFDEVEVVIADTAASVDAGPDQTLCLDPIGLSFTMNAQDPTSIGGVGTWQLVSGLTGFTIDDVNSPTATFTNLLDGTYVFEWVITYGNCTAATAADQVEIEVGIPPTPANIQGGDQVICAQTNTVITADPIINPISETGVWTVVSGPNTPAIDDPENNSINVTGLSTGSYVFRWTTVSNSPLCNSSFDEINVDVYAPASAGNDQDLCEVTSVFLQATAGTTGTWTIVSTTNPAGTASFAPSQSPSNSSSANAPVEPGYEYVYEYTTDYTGPGVACNNADQVTITVSAGPSEDPIAGDDQDICIGDTTTATLTALNPSIPSGVTSEWRLLSQPGGATVGFTNQNNSLTTDVTGLTIPGLYVLELNFSTNSCTDKSDIVRVEVFEAPTPVEAGPDQPIACQETAQLNATTPTVGIGTWTFANPADDPSGGIVVIDSPNNPQTTLSNIPNDIGDDGIDDIYVLTWTVTNNPPPSDPPSPSDPFQAPSLCAPQSDTVTLTFTGTPPSPAEAGPDQELCNETSTFLGATDLLEGTGTWTQTAGAAANIAAPNNPNSLINGLATGVYEFTWTAVGGGCTDTDTVEIVVFADPISAEAGPDQTLPEFASVTLGADPAMAGQGTWSLVSGPSSVNFSNENDPNSQVSGTSVGTYVFQWTVMNGPCSIASDVVTVNILPISDLELSKSVSPSNVNVGDVVTFTVSIFNDDSSATNSDATGVSVQDILPLGYSLVPGTVSNSGSFDVGTQTITWNNLTILNGQTLDLTFNATVNSSGPYQNTAQIIGGDNEDPDSDPNNDDGDQSEDDEDDAIISIQSSDLELSKNVSPSLVSVGDTVTFTIEVSNNGPDDATNVIVNDQLPSGFTYQSDNSGGNYNSTTGNWIVGTVSTSTPISIEITATVNTPTGSSNEYFNTAEITTSDQADPDSDVNNDDGDQSEDDEDNASITLEQADIEITKTVSPTSGAIGDAITFSILVENNGPGDATGVDIEDQLPSGLDIIPGTVTNGGIYIIGTNTIEWTDLTLTNVSSITLSYDATVNNNGNYTNTVQVIDSDLVDPDSTPDNDDGDQSEDDEDAATYTVLEADLSIAKGISASSSATP
ncbi:MAG: PKD domain-containing protein, partial [bacterium]